MSDKTSKIPDSLIDALKAGQVVPFVGAGVSRSVEKKEKDPNKNFNPLFPNWKELVEILADTLEREGKPDEAELVRAYIRVKHPKYLDAMQHVFEELGESVWYMTFDKILGVSRDKADENSLELPKIVWELSNNLIITGNVDRVLQWTCPNQSDFRILDTQTAEYAQLQKEYPIAHPTVWHLHGHIDNKEKIIFTREQYEAFYDKKNHEAKLQTLFNFLTRHTFLFIGFSLDDPYFLKQLEYIHEVYKGGADSFYVLLRESEIEKSNLPNYIKPIPFSDFGKPLVEKIREILDLVKVDGDKENPKPPPNPPEEAIKTHFNVPFASKGDSFVGRQGLREKIWESLNSSGRAAIGQAVSIKGIGGLGKTQLAVEYAHGYRDRYENGVFWLTADQDLDIQLIKIGEDLNWISQFDTGFDQAELVRNRFRKLSDCLIIFDNLDDQEVIANYLPVGDAKPHILVTSREEQDDFYPINLDILSPNEARQLLTDIAEREPKTVGEKEALENILTELDGLPLAVELVGGYLLRRKNISFENYFKYLESEPLERLEKRFPNIALTHHDKSIIRTLKISEEFLNETKYLEEILDILAWGGKSSMGFSLLRQLVGTDDDFALQDALGVALELHFIKQEEDAERYAIHRLLARVRQFEKPLETRKEWYKKIIDNLVKWFSERKDDFKYLLEFEAEVIHLQQWQSQSSENFPIETVYLTDFEAYPLWHRGNYRESKVLLETALDLYQKNKLGDEKLLANLYNDLGVITTNLGNIRQGFEFQKNALSIGFNVFDEKSEDIAKFLDNVGGFYKRLGNFQKAFELTTRALEIRQETFGKNHPSIATSLSTLGGIYGELGDFQKAFELHLKSFETCLELYGEKHPDVASSLIALGEAYGDLRDLQRALELQQQALKIYQELFGDKHPNVAACLSRLGATYSKLDNHKKALELLEQAFEMAKELLGDKHPIVAASLGNLGTVYGDLNDNKKALELKQQSLEITLGLYGEKHPEVATCLNNIGWTYGKLNNHQKSIEYHSKALEMIQEISGNRHPTTILYCKNLILELVDVGFREKAGRLAGEFLSYVPQNNPYRKIFEEYGAAYRKAKQRKKKRRH